MTSNYIAEFLDFFVPRFCIACNSSLKVGNKFICNSCESSIQLLTEFQITSEFKRKFQNENTVDGYTSQYVFEEGEALQKLIHALKYENKFKVGIFLGQKLGNYKNQIIKTWNADFIVPIPLFHLKRVERGFNQSFYIAKGLSYATKIPIENNLVNRAKNTVSQTALNLTERKENLHKAFILNNRRKITGKRIIIIDDVITTGATVSELARTFKENGAEKVFTISIATPPISHSIGSTDSENS